MKETYTDLRTPHITEVNLMDLAKFLFTCRRLIFAGTIAIPLIVLVWCVFFKVAQFKSSAVLQIASEDTLGLTFPSTFGGFGDEKIVNKKMFVLESFFESREFRKALLQEVYGPSEIFDKDDDLSEAKKIVKEYLDSKFQGGRSTDLDLADNLAITQEKDNDTLIVSATTWSSVTSRALAKLAASLLVAFNFNKNLSHIQTVKNFLENQTEDTKARLNELESQLTSLQTSENSVSLQDVGNLMDKEQIELRSKQRALNSQYKANNFLLAEFKGEMGAYLQQLKNGTPSYLYLMQLQRKIELFRYQLKLTNNNRDPATEAPSQAQLDGLVKDFDGEMKRNLEKWPSMSPWDYLQALEKNINEIRMKQKALRGEISAGEEALKLHGKEFSEIPEKIQKLAELKRNIEVEQKLYSELHSKLQDAQIREAGQKNNLVLVVNPELPKKAEGLRLMGRMLAGLILGFSIPLMMLVFLYFVAPKARGKNDIEEMHFDCLGEIPKFSENKFWLRSGGNPLVVQEKPGSLDATAFRNIRFRFNRRFKPVDGVESGERGKVATFFSAHSGEGKTYTIANLACSLNDIGHRVLLLDLDITKHDLEKYFKASVAWTAKELPKGFGDVPFEAFEVNHRLGLVKGIATGSDFTNFLEGQQFAKFLKNLQEGYDFILIDTPPLASHFESIAVSKHSDLMVLVANQRGTLRDDIWATARKVNEIYGGPVSVVLNFSYDSIRRAS